MLSVTEGDSSPLLVTMGLALSAIQDLAFPLSFTTDAAFPWTDSPAAAAVSKILSYMAFGASASVSLSLQQVSFFTAVTWAAIMFASHVWLLFAHSSDQSAIRSLWPYRLLHAMFLLAKTILLVPIMGGFFSVFVCYSASTGPSHDALAAGTSPADAFPYGTWAFTDLSCYGGSHIALIIGVTLIAGLFALQLLYLEAALVDRSPVYNKKRPFRRTTGRVDAAVTAGRIVMCLAFGLRLFLHHWVLTAVTALYGLLSVTVYVSMQPYIAPFMNRFLAAMSGLRLWAAIACVLGIIADDPTVRPLSSSILSCFAFADAHTPEQCPCSSVLLWHSIFNIHRQCSCHSPLPII